MKKLAILLGVLSLVLITMSPAVAHAATTATEVTTTSAPTPAPADNNSPAESTKVSMASTKKTVTKEHQDRLPQTNESKSSIPLTLVGITLLIGLFFNKNKFLSE